MKRIVTRVGVALLAFSVGLWWTAVLNNPWLMSKYHRGEFAESCLLHVMGAVCLGLAALGFSSRKSEGSAAYNILMLSLGLLFSFTGWHMLIGILSGGRVIYDSLLD